MIKYWRGKHIILKKEDVINDYLERWDQFQLLSFKGLCHEMNNVLEGLINLISTVLVVYAAIVFKNFCCLVREKFKD